MSQELTQEQYKSLTLSEKLRLKRSQPALILDVSGSMAADIEPGVSKLQALRNIVQDLPITECYWFSDNFGKCTKDTIPDTKGGTQLAPILQHLQTIGQKNAVIITDGDINDKQATLEAVKGMNIKIMYVGSGNRPKFLDELANACNGWATTDDLKQQKSLTSKLILLLESSEKPRGAFEL